MANIPTNTNSREREPGEKPWDLSHKETERQVPVRIEKEQSRESELERLEREILEAEPREQQREQPSNAPAPQPAQGIAPKDPLTKEVEDIMSEDLGPMYAKLSPAQQAVFKREGERAAVKIRMLLEHAKVKAKSVIDIIRRWLRLIPGVNRFFLEQEAKIKSDRVLALHRKIHHR